MAMPMTPDSENPFAFHKRGETLLLLSFKQRDNLADQLISQGFRVVAARRAEGIVGRFLALDAALVVLDARGAYDQALAAAEVLADSVAAMNANILLLYDRADATRIHGFADTGVTAMLPSPWHDAELALAIGLARRRTAPYASTAPVARQLWWHGDLINGTIEVDSASDSLIGDALLGTSRVLRDILARLSAVDRQRALAAYRKLRREGGYAAFSQSPQDAGVDGLFVHHLMMIGRRLAGHVEWIDNQATHQVAGPIDALTGLSVFADCMAEWRGRDGGDAPVTHVALIRLDGLDAYRTIVGSAAGDALLRSFAKQLHRAVRQELGHNAKATSAPDGGFAVIVTGPDEQQQIELEIRLLAASLAEAVLAPVHQDLRLRMAYARMQPGDGPGALLERLDRLLAVPQALVDQLDVHAALAQGQIIVRFQPQYAFADDGLKGAEALARWHHPHLGELGGAALFSAANAAGLGHRVSLYIWRAAIAAMAAWPESLRELRVALNITAQDMADPALAGTLLALARDHGVDPVRLAVEVTESAVIARLDQAAANLTALRAAGVKVALDDFGTGYSGLAWLKHLPVDYIKIDSGFARDASGSTRDSAVLRGVIDLAQALGMGVLAEGVESVRQRDQLRVMGCRWYQGFLMAPALDSTEFVAFAAAT